MRGISLQFGDDPEACRASFAPIAEVGANTVRILWWESGDNQYGGEPTSVENMKASVDLAIENGLVPVPEFHGATCQGEPWKLERIVDKWVEIAPVFAHPYYAQHMIVNIANEWGHISIDREIYEAAYVSAVNRLREAGYRNLLMVDANHCGQDFRYTVNGASHRILEADPLRNVVFSLHAYNWLWDSREEMDRNLALVMASGLPFVFGEHGSLDYDGVDSTYLQEISDKHGIGYISWSWKGNGGRSAVLDMSEHYDRADVLTDYGKLIIEGTHGIRKSSRPASLFK
jgi:mannan endo-1,4-beta-mannosidase